jgi:anti-anti-sigma factor
MALAWAADRDPSVFTITVSGEVDLATDLEELDGDLVGRRVVIDVSGVTFAGSTFLAWLIRTKEQAGGLTLVHPSDAVRHLLKLAGLVDEFTVEP